MRTSRRRPRAAAILSLALAGCAAVMVGAGPAARPARADDTSAAVTTARAEIGALLEGLAPSSSQAAKLAAADRAFERYRGVNDVADVQALAEAATSVARAAVEDAELVAAVQVIANCCLSIGQDASASVDASAQTLALDKNVKKVGKKLAKAGKKIEKAATKVEADPDKALKDLAKAFKTLDVAAALVLRLGEAEEAFFALPPGIRVVAGAGAGFLTVRLETTSSTKYLFRSIVFVGDIYADGEKVREVRRSAAADDPSGFDNLEHFGFVAPMVYTLDAMLSEDVLEVVDQHPGQTRRLKGTFTMRLRKGFSGPFKAYLHPVDLTF